MNGLLFRERHEFVMENLANDAAVVLMCLTPCLSSHLEWWECLNTYKCTQYPIWNQKRDFFLTPWTTKCLIWFHNEAIIHMQRLTPHILRRKIAHSVQFEWTKSAKDFLRYVKNARGGGDLLFLVECIYINPSKKFGNLSLIDRFSFML